MIHSNSHTSTSNNNHPNQTGNNSSEAVSKCQKVSDSILIQLAIEQLNSKEYNAEYIMDGLLPGGNPFVYFSGDNSARAFCTIPKGFKPGGIFDGKLTLVYDIDNTKDAIEQAEDRRNAAHKLYFWACLLPKAVTISIELNVPEELEPDDFATEFADDVSLYNCEINSDDEDDKFLSYSFSISPDMIKPLSREIKAFAKGVKVFICKS